MNEINERISSLIDYLKDIQSYSNIMNILFTKGIYEVSKYISNLKILPSLTNNQLKNNFNKNINKIVKFIKNDVKPPLDLYNVLSCILNLRNLI